MVIDDLFDDSPLNHSERSALKEPVQDFPQVEFRNDGNTRTELDPFAFEHRRMVVDFPQTYNMTAKVRLGWIAGLTTAAAASYHFLRDAEHMGDQYFWVAPASLALATAARGAYKHFKK